MNTETVRKETIARRVVRLMGNRFDFSVCGSDKDHAEKMIDKAVEEIRRIENLLTTFSETSETALINRNAGDRPVTVSQEVFDLISRSLKISRLTQGAFDLSYGSLDKKFWNFDTDMTALPDSESAKNMVRLINYKNIILDAEQRTVLLKEKGMRIGFGGMGKGYAADRARTLLQQAGVTSGVVNASGDLAAWGNQPDGRPWTIGIADPAKKHHPFSSLAVSNMAVATSGDYEKFVTINGKRYAHTIDPKTGFPVSGIKSVTIICPSAEIADSMATPVMVMGVKAGLSLINQIKSMACIIIDENDKLYTSNNIKLN